MSRNKSKGVYSFIKKAAKEGKHGTPDNKTVVNIMVDTLHPVPLLNDIKRKLK